MRATKFSQSRIVTILKEAESGVPVADLLWRHGVGKATFFKSRDKYAGATATDVKRLRELEAENAKEHPHSGRAIVERKVPEQCRFMRSTKQNEREALVLPRHLFPGSTYPTR